MSELSDNFGLINLAIETGDENGFGGRTRLQKMTYFSRQLGWDLSPYRFHYYGPYSKEITETLQAAIKIGMVREARVERKACRYTLSDEGRDFFGICLDECDHDLVKRTRQLFSVLSRYTEDQLELAATVDYVKKHEPESSRKKVIMKVNMFKDNNPPVPVDDAYDIWLRIMRHIRKLAPPRRQKIMAQV